MYESKEYRATVNNSLNLARIRVLTEKKAISATLKNA